MTIYRNIKWLFRWLAFHISPKGYRAYSSGNVGGYSGSYDVLGRCIAFRREDGSIQFRW